MDKLLLIDDEVDVQYSFRRLFQSADFELHTASSGEEGLQLAARLKPALVLLDIRMGAGMNGLETLRRLRQTDARLPVIMMTAHGSALDKAEAEAAGVFKFVQKPFDLSEMTSVVREATAKLTAG